MTALDIARGELGVKESPKNSNNVKYNTWYYGREVSGAAYPWCMAFVQWCYDRAGARLPYKTASCSALLDWYKRNEPERIVTDPQPGDIAIYNFGHTGIVEIAAANTVTAIEGNTAVGNDSNGGEVMRRTRKRSLVRAYIRPEPLVKETPKEDDEMLSYEEFKEYMERYIAELSERPAPNWAKAELQEAIDAGITDGTRPMAFVRRYEAALMSDRAQKGAEHE